MVNWTEGRRPDNGGCISQAALSTGQAGDERREKPQHKQPKQTDKYPAEDGGRAPTHPARPIVLQQKWDADLMKQIDGKKWDGRDQPHR